MNPAPCPEPTPGEPAPPGFVACGSVRVGLDNGPGAGTQVTTSMPSGPGAPVVKAGDRVVLVYLPDSPSGQAHQIVDHQRGRQLWILALAFVAAVVAFGRWRGRHRPKAPGPTRP
ncbi:hypothetical protein ACNTMW_05635 [Planosporangium sp. 12N6]|uniref:hypothetical protein n=1 Tax=Planosporangium spinosum TaxID=3402278 RepID=UPI003CE8DF9E